MNHKKYYPFERNHYFYGKLLTVRDFHDEQKYFNDKRRIQNMLLHGAGVVSGLRVVPIDDKTISIESGMALDYQGREIIVEDSMTKKLNVIEGFDDLEQTRTVYLCLAYAEHKTEMVHRVDVQSTNGQEGDFNRIQEGYRIFLKEDAPEDRILWQERMKTSKKVLFDKMGVKITQQTPMFVQAGEPFEMEITVEKINLGVPVEIEYWIHSEYFAEEYDHIPVKFQCDDTVLNQKAVFSVVAKAEAVGKVETVLSMKSGESRISIGADTYQFDADENIAYQIVQESPANALVSRYFEMHFDDVMHQNMEEPIYLAKFKLAHYKREYSIIDCEWLPFGQFILNNRMLHLLADISSQPSMANPQPIATESNLQESYEAKQKYMTSGTEEIMVDLHAKDHVYFSDEISHGLGKGDVQVCAAVHEIPNGNSIFDQSCTYFGNLSILQNTPFESALPPMEVAVIAYPEKGTFRIALKILGDIQTTVVPMKWWAQCSAENKREEYAQISRISVQIHPDTITLQPRAQHKFSVTVEGTDYTECRWSVVETDGGKIDRNGVYEAPNKEGVYEIVAENLKYPNKKSTAFIVVREG